MGDISKALEEKQSELIQLTKKYTALYKKADFRSKSLLTLGSTIFISQFAFIMSGTFVYYSWDVMEPISYVMMLGNFTAGMLFYANYKDEMQLTTVRKMLADRFAKRIFRRNGFDEEKMIEL